MFNAVAFLATLPQRPGVYCMRDKADKVLYVGKAKNLKNRLASYFRTLDNARIMQMVSLIASIDVTVTHSETEALLLENSLIKSLKPRYNVIFRDDKSYPYLFLSAHTFPRLVYFRGKQKAPGRYFGPFPSAMAVKETLTILQKLFKLRQCDDTFFNHRSRPCLQYQIQRCTAPCVKYISEADYQKSVTNAALFLEGKQTSIIDDLVKEMEEAAQNHHYEVAATLRDQIQNLRIVSDQQRIHRSKGDVDVIAACEHKGNFCLQVVYVRHGQVLDSQSYFPKQAGEGTIADLLRSFLIQFYLDSESKLDYPAEIVVNETFEDQALIAQSLSQILNRPIQFIIPTRGDKKNWLALALENAEQALMRKLASQGAKESRWQELKKVLGIHYPLNKIECFDISHFQSEATIASCVVFEQIGPLKADYRRYNLEVNANDDYAAMEAVLTKRYLKCKLENLPLPEIIMVDGGKGQLHRAKKVMNELQIVDVLLIGIAKGEGRKPGLETLYVTRTQVEEEWIIKLPPTSQALHLLQNIRDEAHRFAIRAQRQKVRTHRKHSPLEAIPGIGIKRRQQLINYFGGQQALSVASIEAIAKVPGISKALAEKIYAALH